MKTKYGSVSIAPYYYVPYIDIMSSVKTTNYAMYILMSFHSIRQLPIWDVESVAGHFIHACICKSTLSPSCGQTSLCTQSHAQPKRYTSQMTLHCIALCPDRIAAGHLGKTVNEPSFTVSGLLADRDPFRV